MLHKANEWNQFGNVGLVAGATRTEALHEIRQAAPELCLLIPGVGAQGGSLTEAIRYGVDKEKASAVINIGRALIYPEGEYKTVSAFEQAIAKRAEEHVQKMRQALCD